MTTLKTFHDLPRHKPKMWGVHRPDGLLLTFTLSETKDAAIHKFIKSKYPTLPKSAVKDYWSKVWAKVYKYQVNEILNHE